MHALDGIEPGQPILVGHHSERHHRRALRLHDSRMRRACDCQNMAEHHEHKADGLEYQLGRSIYSDDDDAVEALKAKALDADAEADRCVCINREIRKGPGWEARVSPPLTDHEQKALLRAAVYGYSGKVGFPSYHLTGLRAKARQARQRIKELECRQAKQTAAEQAGGVMIDRNGDYCTVTFAEKPAYATIAALKAADFHWCGGSWNGAFAALPAEELAEQSKNARV